VDGVMVGRGAVKNPWVFLQIGQQMRGEAPMVVTADEKRRVLLGYFQSIRDAFRSDHGSLGRMKKIANYFTHGLPHGSALRVAFLHSQSIEEAVRHTERYFERLAVYETGGGWERDETDPVEEIAASA
jgi:tRNA-dihydrouridine synthase